MAALSDEVLCAYIDGALSPDERAGVERLLHEHPELLARVDLLRAGDAALRRMAEGAPAASSDPIAERIRAAAPPRGFSRWRPAQHAPLLSAALVAGFLGLAAGRLTPAPVDTLTPDPALAHALETAASGQTQDGVRVILTFETQAATPCRQFAATRAGQTGEGVACRTDGHWRILAWIAAATGSSEGYHAAGANDALDSVIDTMDATGALSADDEAGYLRRHWSRK